MLSWKKLVLAIILIGFTAQYAMSADIWVNDLRKMFTKNSSIIYDPNQISILGYAQYENRTKYLEDLKNKTKELIKIIKASEANK